MRAHLLIAASAILQVVVTVATLASDTRVPERLSDTGLYALGRPFSPQYPLWTDGAKKMRWVYLPPGTQIDALDDADWDFPVGTRFWKEFSFNGRKVETRMLWKAEPAGWIAVSYRWNDAGTEALLAPEHGEMGVAEISGSKRHSIPSRAECLMCHGTKRTGPLGFNPLQLSTDRDPNAIHGEPLEPDMVTLQTLVAERRFTTDRRDLLVKPPRVATEDAQTRTILGYFAANCGTCHNATGEIATLGPSLRYSDVMREGDAIARKLLDHPTHWQAPGAPERSTVLVSTHAPDTSAILLRMRSRQPSSQMPPLGTVVRDTAALDAVAQWITRIGCRQPTDRTTPEPLPPSVGDKPSSARDGARDGPSCRASSPGAASP